MPRPDSRAASVEVVGQLSVLADRTPFLIEFRGQVIDVVFNDLRSVIRLGRFLAGEGSRARLRSVHSALVNAGLEVQVWVGRHRIGRIGASARRSWLAVRLGVDPFEPRIAAIATLLIRRDRPKSADPQVAPRMER